MIESKNKLEAAMRRLTSEFPGCAIVLLVAPFDAPPGARVNYIGNGQRDGVRAMMKEMMDRWDGYGHDGPGAVQ